MPVWILLALLPSQFAPSGHFTIAAQRNAMDAFVRITDRSAVGGGVGSGAIVGADDHSIYVLSAFHVVDPGLRLELECFGRDGYPQKGPTFRDGIHRVGVVPSADIALLRIRTDFRPAHFVPVCAAAAPVHDGQPVLTLGCSRGQYLSCVEDAIQGMTLRRRDDGWINFWVTAGLPVDGRSGGPLLNVDGRLIGICRGILTGNADYPSEGLYASLEQIHGLISSAGLVRICEQGQPALGGGLDVAAIASGGGVN